MDITDTYEPQNALEAVELTARKLAENGKNTEKKIRDAMKNAARPFDDAESHEVYQYIEREVNEIMQQEMEENPIVKGMVHVDGTKVNVIDADDITLKEVRNYVSYVKENQLDFGLELRDLEIRRVKDKNERDEKIDLQYHVKARSFERIRRITGYLVGTIDRWNNAKRAEEHDRVKHTPNFGAR